MSVVSENPERNNDLSRGVESIRGQCDYTNMECARRRQQPDLIIFKPQCTCILCTRLAVCVNLDFLNANFSDRAQL
jgi:hypothetical protein